MTPFLHGFADELIKVAATPFGQPPAPGASGVTRPPQPGAVPKPPNIVSSGAIKPIPTQRMESPMKTTPNTWRPSPGFRPSPAAAPAATPTAKKSGTVKKPAGGAGNDYVPWETAGQGIKRRLSEGFSQMGQQTKKNEAAYQASPDKKGTDRYYTSGSANRMGSSFAPRETPKLTSKAQGAGYMQQEQYNSARRNSPENQQRLERAGGRRIEDAPDMRRHGEHNLMDGAREGMAQAERNRQTDALTAYSRKRSGPPVVVEGAADRIKSQQLAVKKKPGGGAS